MKKEIYILILVLFISLKTNAQIYGQLFQDDYSYPGAKVFVEGQSEIVESDFDGNFELFTSKNAENVNLIIDLKRGFSNEEYSNLKVIIKNFELGELTKIDLGEIHLPNYKSISIKEFERLTKAEQKNCLPIYHYANLLGYEYSNQLSEEFILLTCKNGNRLTEFEFDEENKLVIIEWENLKMCK